MVDRLGFVVPPSANGPTKATDDEPDPLKKGEVYKWALEQAALIRDGRFDQVDRVNVADEIESLGRSEFRSLASNLEIILAYVLKWDHQPRRRSRSWIHSIEDHRLRVCADLSDSPGLKARVDEAIEPGYRLARYVAERETGLSRKRFPVSCPYD